MFSLIRLILKFVFLSLLFFSISQIKISDKKIYFHTEDFISKVLGNHKNITNKYTLNLSTQKIKLFIKKKILYLFEEEKTKPTRSKIKNLYTEESDMDEKALQKILGN